MRHVHLSKGITKEHQKLSLRIDFWVYEVRIIALQRVWPCTGALSFLSL